MKVVIEKHICDMCKREINPSFTPGKLVFSYSVTDWAGNGAPAGCKYEELCRDCCIRIDSAIAIAKTDRKGGKE